MAQQLLAAHLEFCKEQIAGGEMSILLTLRDEVPAETVERLVEALYTEGQSTSPSLGLAVNLMALQSAKEVRQLRQEQSTLWKAIYILGSLVLGLVFTS